MMIKQAGILIIAGLVLACSSQQVYQGTEQWRLESCRQPDQMDPEACEERARQPLEERSSY